MVNRKRYTASANLVVFAVSAIAALACWCTNRALNVMSTSVDDINFWSRLLFFDRILAESLAFSVVGCLLFNSLRSARIAFYSLFVLWITIYGLQMFNISLASEFLNPLVLENIIHIRLFLTVPKIIVVGCIFLSWMAIIVFIEKRCTVKPTKHRLTVILALSSVIFFASESWLPREVTAGRRALVSIFMMTKRAPAEHFVDLLTMIRPRFETDPRSQATLEELSSIGIRYDDSSDYPFLKDMIHDNKLPFAGPAMPASKPNVIVFFSEGMSARSLDPYGSIIPNLTPNLLDFSRVSMRVDGYYNHTASTDRGIKGQLCSSFPYSAHADGKTYRCLPEMLGDHGYKTVFLNANGRHNSALHDLVSQLKFSEVISAETASEKYLNKEQPNIAGKLDDRQIFQTLIKILEEHRTGQDKRPLFLAMYNVQTHVNVYNGPDDKNYGDGSNYTLNTIHNFDDQFGRFWKYFQRSTFADTTVIFFTSDHCHYYEKSFVESFADASYQHLFVDRIPLIIHDPRRDLPQVFDGTVSSSIDFAPSVAHYLGMQNEVNAFRGISVFQRDQKSRMLALAGYGPNAYIIETGGIRSVHSPGKFRTAISIFYNHLQYGYFLEKNNRIFPDDRVPRTALRQ